MSTDPLSARATPARLRALYEQGTIDAGALDSALAAACATPSARAWRHFLDRLLAGVGLALVVSGALTFIAFNWAELGRFARFGVTGLWIVSGVVVAWVRGAERIDGRLGLLASAMGVGGLLAVIGQTYQTGADDWTLFATWAALIVPWVVISRFAALWFLEVVLSNLALGFWVGQVAPEYGEWAPIWLALLNGGAWLAWQAGRARWPFLRVRWAPRGLALATTVLLGGLAMVLPFDAGGPSGWVATVGLLGLAAGLVALVHREPHHDRFPATVAALFVVLVFNAWGLRFLDELGLDELPALGVLLLAFAVIAQAAGFVAWLRQLPSIPDDLEVSP